MVFRYYTSSFKKNLGSEIFPVIFLFPILILIAINMIAAGNSYQQYRFHKNSNFKVMTNTVCSYDNSFFSAVYPISAQYIEEFSTKDSPFYNAGTSPMIYFCKNMAAIETSYFTPENLIAGELPNNENFQKLQTEGRFPICISYDSAVEAGSWVGDHLDITLWDDDHTVYHFQITGILYPDGNKERIDSEGNRLPTLACAFIDEQTYDTISASFPGTLYCNFLKENKILNGQTSSITMEEMMASIASELDGVQLTITLAASGFIIIVLSCITYSLLKFKIKGDTAILYTMGMHGNRISLIHFWRSVSVLLMSVLLSGLFIKFVYLPLIVNKYFDFIFLGAIGLAEAALGIVTCGVMAFIIPNNRK